MKLIISGDSKQADAFLPVSWCIEPKDTEKIVEKEIVNPHILFITASSKSDIFSEEGELNWEETSREIIPINHQTVYTTFNRPGQHRVFATIIGDKDGVSKKLRKKIKDAWSGQFVKRSGDFTPPEPYLGKAVLDVYVPEEFFAPEPPEWEKSFMRLWFNKDLPTDQCDWRKRRIFAYTLMMPLLLIYWAAQFIIRVAVAGAYFVNGSRGIYFHPIWDFSEEISAIYKENHATWQNSIFRRDNKGNPRFLSLAMHPMFLTIATVVLIASSAAILAVLGYNWRILWELFRQAWWVFLLFLAAGGGAAALSGYVFNKLDAKWAKYKAGKEDPELAKARRERERVRRLLAQRKSQLELMTCDKTAGGSLSSYHSMVLTFQGVKSKVCRPFRQRS